MSAVKFTTSPAEFALVGRIADRARAIWRENREPGDQPQPDRMLLMMDLAATHANGNPMDFAGLLAADDGNFMHDVCGIARHLDRETGRLLSCFSPRYSQRDGQVTA